MKKIIFALIALTLVLSCQDDVEFNRPSFQGIKDGDVLWKATSYTVSIDDNGFLTLSGVSNQRTLTLTIPSVSVGTYSLGDVDAVNATYQEFGVSYDTANDGVGSIVYVSDGEVVLNEIDLVSSTFTGTFKFNAYNASGTDVVNFIEGVFYQVPLTSGTIPTDPYTCLDAQAQTATALAAFNNTDLSDSDEYVANCSAYLAALENQMIYCGSEGTEDIIEGLNECVYPCEYAENNSADALAALNAATVGNYATACNNYGTVLAEQIGHCGDPAGTIQATIDGLNCADADNDGIADVLEDINGDGDPSNDDTDLDTIPDYMDDDDDGDGVLTVVELNLDADGNPADTDGDGIFDYLDIDDDNDGVETQFETATPDTDGDGIVDYLDTDDDGDGILTMYENPDANNDGDPADAQDTDGDGTADYLDIDDDGDGANTIDENADPDADGNPADAMDTDGDGTADYLDNM